MNIGYMCKKCGNRKTNAKLMKLGESLVVEIDCFHCHAQETIDISSFGLDFFEPKVKQK